MLSRAVIVLVLMMLASGVAAQTATPGCAGGIDIGNLNIGGQCTSNTIDADMKSDIYRVMATAAYNVNKMPEEIKKSGPAGKDISGSTSGAVQLFGYAKWVMSPNTAQELMGKSLAPFGINVFVIFLLITSLTAIYFLVNLIVIVIKFVAWVINQLLKLIPFW
jgi:hypothetical protein